MWRIAWSYFLVFRHCQVDCVLEFLWIFFEKPHLESPMHQCYIDFEKVSGRLNNLTPPACALFSCATSADSILRIFAGDGKVPIMLNLGILTVLNSTTLGTTLAFTVCRNYSTNLTVYLVYVLLVCLLRSEQQLFSWHLCKAFNE